MQRFKAILLREFQGHKIGTIVEVAAGEEGFDGKWLVLRPLDLVGSWLVPLVDVDRAITVKEAAHILSVRRGWKVWDRSVARYIESGRLAPAGRIGEGMGVTNKKARFMSLEATWKMPFPEMRGHPRFKRKENE